MNSALPPVLPSAPASAGEPVPTPAPNRRNTVTFKLLFIAALVVILHLPLHLINQLRLERSQNREQANAHRLATGIDVAAPPYNPKVAAAEGYRMVERALKHSMLVLTLTFAAFFLFETLAGLRLHAVHYGLVGAAMCLFYFVERRFARNLVTDKSFWPVW